MRCPHFKGSFAHNSIYSGPLVLKYDLEPFAVLHCVTEPYLVVDVVFDKHQLIWLISFYGLWFVEMQCFLDGGHCLGLFIIGHDVCS